MSRGPQILSPQQQSMLSEAREAKLALDKAEAEAKVEIEAAMNARLLPLKARLARAITHSISNGVPKSRVNLEVLGVTTPNAWQRWTDMDQNYQGGPVAVAQVPSEPQFAAATIPGVDKLGDAAEPVWPLPTALRVHPHASHFTFVGNPADRVISVVWQGYESAAADAPETLAGVVRYDPESPTRWSVVTDPQDKPTPFGVETGALTYEVAERRGEVQLRTALNEYVAAADLPEFVAPGLDADDEDEEGDGF